jgi:hypothetical protein
MKRILGLTLPFALILSTTAFAASERGNGDLKRYCSGDAATFCGGVDPGGKEMDACFREHRKELSENCGRAIDAYQARGGK